MSFPNVPVSSMARLVRTLGTLYPAFVLLVVVVATGNHFFLAAAPGALVDALGIAAASLLTRPAVRKAPIALPLRGAQRRSTGRAFLTGALGRHMSTSSRCRATSRVRDRWIAAGSRISTRAATRATRRPTQRR